MADEWEPGLRSLHPSSGCENYMDRASLGGYLAALEDASREQERLERLIAESLKWKLSVLIIMPLREAWFWGHHSISEAMLYWRGLRFEYLGNRVVLSEVQ